MLVLSRRRNEKICFPDVPLVIQVLGVKGGVVRLGIAAPPEISVRREELAARPAWDPRSHPRPGAGPGRTNAEEVDFLLRTICAGLGLTQLRLQIGRTRSLEILLGKIHERVLRLRRLLRPGERAAVPVAPEPAGPSSTRLRRVVALLPAVLSVLWFVGCGGRPVEAGPVRSTGSVVAQDAEPTARPPHEGQDAASAPKADANQVAIENFAFGPGTLTVRPGTTVTWVNRDDVPHTVTSASRPRLFGSKALDTDDRFSHTFTSPGTYEYFCTLHPRMTGKIIVEGERK